MIATGSIGAAVQGLGACSTSGDELTELLAGITGTEVVSAGQLGCGLCRHGTMLFPKPPAEGGIYPQPGLSFLVLFSVAWGLAGCGEDILRWGEVHCSGCPFLAK